REHDVEEGDVDLAAPALEDLGDESEGGGDPGRVVDGRVAGERGRPARLTGQGGHARARLDHVVERGELGGGAIEPVPGEGDAHELGVVPAQRLVGQPELLDRRRPQVYEQGVGRLRQGAQLRL